MTQQSTYTAGNLALTSDAMVAPRQAQSAVDTYRKEQLTNLSPVQVINKLLEVAIRACKQGDKRLALRAITELILALNFEHKEIALGFFRLYDYCKQRIHSGDMDEAIFVLEDLRATWAKAFHLKEAA